MLFLCMPKDDLIIQIDDTICQVELFQCILYQVLEGCRHVTEFKRHLGKFMEAQVTNCECSVLLQLLWGHVDLPESTLKIHCREVCSSCHALQYLLYLGQGVQIFLCPCVEPSKVHIKSKGSILLPHQHHHITPGWLAGSDGTGIQHISERCANLFQERQGNMPKTFFAGFIIIDVNLMLNGIGTSQLIGLECEDVMIGKE